jgi:hypothetical protein
MWQWFPPVYGLYFVSTITVNGSVGTACTELIAKTRICISFIWSTETSVHSVYNLRLGTEWLYEFDVCSQRFQFWYDQFYNIYVTKIKTKEHNNRQNF